MVAASRERIDILLVERGLASSRKAAQALIMSGRVAVDGRTQQKPGTRIPRDAAVTVAARMPFVGRGGLKLAGALEALGLDVAGLIVLDVGASTGGFTDCLLQRGARRVYAIDVGHGQIDWRLRNDPRVVVLEGVNARYLSASDLRGLPRGADMAVIDVSFISLRLILPRIPPLLGRRQAGGASILALVKPQFEAGRRRVGHGGIVRSAHVRREVLLSVAAFGAAEGLGVAGLARSPIRGTEGNHEYFIHFKTGPPGLSPEQVARQAARLVGEDEHQD